MPGFSFSVEIFNLVPILKAQAKDSFHRLPGVLTIKHYIGKEASNMVCRSDQPAELFEYRPKIWKK